MSSEIDITPMIREFGHDSLVPALSLSIYFERPNDEIREGLVHLWKHVLPIYEPNLRWYLTEQMSYKEPVDPDSLQMIPTWFDANAPVRNRYVYFAQGGDDPEAISPWAVELYAYDTKALPAGSEALAAAIFGVPMGGSAQQANCLRLSFPVLSEAFTHEDLCSLTRFAAAEVPCLHANAGYSLLFDPLLDSAWKETWTRIAGLALRHPGYDVLVYESVFKFVYDKIKTVNWLTVLGARFASCFRDNPNRLEWSVDVKVEEVGGAMVIQAGRGPAIGDLNRGDTLPLYREIASQLAPWLCFSHWAFGRIFDEEKTERWLHRFVSNE